MSTATQTPVSETPTHGEAITYVPPTFTHRLGWFLRDTKALAGRSVKYELRHVDGLFTGIFLPVALLLLFVYVFGGAMDVGGEYLDYVVPGVLVLAGAWGGASTAVGIAQDLTTGTIDRFRAMPMSPASLFAGHVLATVARTLFSTVLVVAVALAIGFRPVASVGGWLAAVGMFTLATLALAWVAVMVGVAARSIEAANGFTFLIVFVPYLSSAFVPPETLPTWLQPVAEHQPMTPVIETVRGLLLDTDVGNAPLIAIIWCVGLIAVAMPASAWLFRRRTRR